MSFETLNLDPAILQALAEAGYTEPTPVQAEAIPAVLQGRDLMVSSQTGSGKTAAFMLPALHLLANPRERTETAENPAPQAFHQQQSRDGRRPRFQPAQPKMLVMTPTRELALQVTSATDKYGKGLRRLKAVAILGGMPYPKQMQLLGRNPQILVATPGRLIDHMRSGKIDFSQLEILVLDEADRMLDMGFIEDIELIVRATPASRQTLLFSATLDGMVGQMAQKITRDAQIIKTSSTTDRHVNIEQRVHFVDDVGHKNRLLQHLLRDDSVDQALVFTATKRNADAISEQLNVAGFTTAALHGDMNQGARNRTLGAMRDGRVRILVATDVAARGIDVPSISHVFNFDLPRSPEDYVHRIGRTGRAGRNGLAISLVHHNEFRNLKDIERFTSQTIPVAVVAGHEPRRSTAPARPRKAGWKPAATRSTGANNGARRDNRSPPRSGSDSQQGASARSGESARSGGGGYRQGSAQKSAATQRGGEGVKSGFAPKRSFEGRRQSSGS